MALVVKKLLSCTAVTVGLVALNAIALCPTTKASEDACAGVIESVSSRMSRGRNLSIDYKRRDVTETYQDAPGGRPIMQVLVLRGSGSAPILKSPVFMQTRAKTIIENCKGVGAVQFAVSGSSYSETFGLMPNGTVKQFSCTESTPIAWGQVLCGGW